MYIRNNNYHQNIQKKLKKTQIKGRAGNFLYIIYKYHKINNHHYDHNNKMNDNLNFSTFAYFRKI